MWKPSSARGTAVAAPMPVDVPVTTTAPRPSDAGVTCGRHEVTPGGPEGRLVDHAADELLGLLREVGLQIGRWHGQSEDTLLRLAVLHVPEPREHGLHLSAGDDEVRVVDPVPAVRLTELLHLPAVDAVVAARDRRAREGLPAEYCLRSGDSR